LWQVKKERSDDIKREPRKERSDAERSQGTSLLRQDGAKATEGREEGGSLYFFGQKGEGTLRGEECQTAEGDEEEKRQKDQEVILEARYSQHGANWT